MSGEGRYAFICPAELHAKVSAAVAATRARPEDAACNKALRGVLLELTSFGLDYYFIRPLELAGVRGGKLKTIKISIGLLRSSVGGFINNVIKPMSGEQVLVLCDFVEGLMVS